MWKLVKITNKITASDQGYCEYSRRVILLNEDIPYLEVKDDGPDEPEGELGVAVDDVLAADVDELDLLVTEEAQRRLHVLDRVEPHPTSLPGLYK